MKRKPKKYVVVSDMYSTIYNDVVMEDLKEFYPDASDELLDELASDLYFGNRRLLMNTFADTIFPTDVICIADLGLWNGRHQAYRVYDAPTLDELFTSGQDIDEAEWYINEYNDLCCNAYHHDGTNHLLYRQIRSEMGHKARENLYSKILSNTLTRKDINHYTLPIGQIVLNAERRTPTLRINRYEERT